MKSEKEIFDAIVELQQIKPKVLRKSAFGDDHWAAIDAQIYILKNPVSIDKIDHLYPPEEGDEINDSAHVAYLWKMDREILDWEFGSLAESWQELVRD